MSFSNGEIKSIRKYIVLCDAYPAAKKYAKQFDKLLILLNKTIYEDLKKEGFLNVKFIGEYQPSSFHSINELYKSFEGKIFESEDQFTEAQKNSLIGNLSHLFFVEDILKNILAKENPFGIKIEISFQLYAQVFQSVLSVMDQ